MKDPLMERVRRLEALAKPASTGKHLTFRIEAPQCTPGEDIITFLRERGHAIHEGDDVFLMNFGALGMAEGEAPRDLSPALLTEQARSTAPAAGHWPKRHAWFTFRLDSPRDLQ